MSVAPTLLARPLVAMGAMAGRAVRSHRLVKAAVGAGALAAFAAAAGSPAPVSPPPEAHADDSAERWQAFLDDNCATCHSERSKAGGLVLAGMALESLGAHREAWQRVLDKVMTGAMPPPTVKRRPDPHQSHAFVAWLTAGLDQYASAHPDPGRAVIRRLTRVEYSNAVRDLLQVNFALVDELPPDLVTDGFDNNAAALAVSPLMLERYARAARLVSRAAIGGKAYPRTLRSIAGPDNQREWRKDLPFGVRGGPAGRVYFPAAGEYIVRVFVDLSGTKVAEGQRMFTVHLPLSAGDHAVAAVVPAESAVPEGPIRDIGGPAGFVGGPLNPTGIGTVAPVLDLRVDGKLVKRFEIQPPGDLDQIGPTLGGAPWIRRMDIDGPVANAATGPTPSRSRVFTCVPAAARDEAACAQRILAPMMCRAFRRDVSAAERDAILDVYRDARPRSDFETAIQEALQAILVSPAFLFRIEEDPRGAAPPVYPVSGFDLASRLSFFLWSSIPDDRLLDLARTGGLAKPAALRRETLRMLDDARADALVDNFAMQFLGLQELDSVEPDKKLYPTFTRTLKQDFLEETRLFLRNIMRTNSSVVDIIGANYTYLNARLADHYGVSDIAGPGFRRVNFAADFPRGGVLGQGSVLLATSHPNVTSPVLRGKWVLSNLLNQPPSPPPPGIPALKAENDSGRKLTGRQQIELHRASRTCASCHARMDPFGFALEHFDVTGRRRASDEAGFVNAVVTMPGGANFRDVAGLRRYLVDHQDEFARAFVAKLLVYALGRRLTVTDAAVVRWITRETKAEDYRFRSLVAAVVASPPFRFRRKEDQP